MSRLQEIEDESVIIMKQIVELHNKNSNLYKEKREIIQANCEHNFVNTGYVNIIDNTGIFKTEMICPSCGLRKWKEG